MQSAIHSRTTFIPQTRPTHLMSLDVCPPAYAILLGSIHHPLAVDLQLGQVEDDAWGRDIVEVHAHEALLERCF